MTAAAPPPPMDAHRQERVPRRAAELYPMDPPVTTGWTNEHALVYILSLALPLAFLVLSIHKMELMAVDPGVPCLVRNTEDHSCVDAHWPGSRSELIVPYRWLIMTGVLMLQDRATRVTRVAMQRTRA